MQKFEYTLFADYFQFYLQDANAEGDLSDNWTPEAVDRFLAVAPGTIGVGTVRNMNVPVVVEVIDRQPDSDLSAWDHVNECTLELPSGRVVIAGCTDIISGSKMPTSSNAAILRWTRANDALRRLRRS